MSASWCKQTPPQSDELSQPAIGPAGSTWRDVLNTDVGSWFHRLCYAMCTPRPWSSDRTGPVMDPSLMRYGIHPFLSGSTADLRIAGHQLNDSMCWNSPMAWGRGINFGGGMTPLALVDMEDDTE